MVLTYGLFLNFYNLGNISACWSYWQVSYWFQKFLIKSTDFMNQLGNVLFFFFGLQTKRKWCLPCKIQNHSSNILHMSLLEEWFTVDIAGVVSKYMFKSSQFHCNQKGLELWNFSWIMKKKVINLLSLIWTYWTRMPWCYRNLTVLGRTEALIQWY